MAPKTKADLLEEIDKLSKRLEEILKKNEELKIENSRLNAELGRQICEKSELRQEIESLNKKIELDSEFYKDNDTMKKKLDETLILSARKTVKISDLEKEIECLKNSAVQKIKNERMAGRKEKFTMAEKQAMKMYRLQGKSIREIASLYKCSVGLIHKLINEQ